MGEEAARNLLGRFLFSNDDVYKSVSALSGGERSRLALARLTLERANFLILDEPTNHLDIGAREALEEVLDGYDGTMLFVSHDRYFVDRIANRIWEVADGGITTWIGNYTDMQRAKAKQLAKAQAQSAESAQQPVRAEPELKPAQQARQTTRTNERALRDAQKRLNAAERLVSRLEGRLNTLSDELTRAGIDQRVDKVAELGREYESVQEELERAYAEWGEANAALEQATAGDVVTAR
jgi:ATP-binding cassette subfamily F protein 3